jgi:RNA polymerase sigma-70 factor, ECF subfamily
MHDAESDDALLDRLARAGDARAFDVLYRRYSERLHATAVRLTRDSDSAPDLVHDAWIRAVESLASFEKRSSFRTWITAILINCIREHERSRRRDGRYDPAGDAFSADEVADPASTAPLDGDGIDPLDLEAAIAALPDGFRRVLVLHDVEGFTHEEIAAALGLAPGTSKSQLSRARRRLRELLAAGIPRTKS